MSAKLPSRRKPAATDAPPADTEVSAGTASESHPARPAVRRVSKKISGSKAPAEALPPNEAPPHPPPPAAAESAAPAEAAPEVVIAVVHEPAAPPIAADRPEPAPDESGWPEPETVGAGEQEGGSKRKRRRRKGKGKGQQQGTQVAEEFWPNRDTAMDAGPLAAGGESQVPPRPAAPQPRVKTDPDLLAKFAWKIYLAEVSEEGIALINDRDAREGARRCFRLAEIFLEEQARQTNGR